MKPIWTSDSRCQKHIQHRNAIKCNSLLKRTHYTSAQSLCIFPINYIQWMSMFFTSRVTMEFVVVLEQQWTSQSQFGFSVFYKGICVCMFYIYKKLKKLFLIYAISCRHNLQAACKQLKPDKPRKIEKAH